MDKRWLEEPKGTFGLYDLKSQSSKALFGPLKTNVVKGRLKKKHVRKKRTRLRF